MGRTALPKVSVTRKPDVNVGQGRGEVPLRSTKGMQVFAPIMPHWGTIEEYKNVRRTNCQPKFPMIRCHPKMTGERLPGSCYSFSSIQAPTPSKRLTRSPIAVHETVWGFPAEPPVDPCVVDDRSCTNDRAAEPLLCGRRRSTRRGPASNSRILC